MDNQSVTYREPPAVMASQALFETDGLSYDEYFKKIEEMISDLKISWSQEQRVNSLKIAIQLSKLLADTNQIKLYSRKYRVITEALKNFGQLIYSRIESKAIEGEGETMASSSTSNNISSQTSTINSRELAKETCRNWFLKVASIRELVPRFYTELTILKICDFLLKPSNLGSLIPEEEFYFQSLRRLTMSARGFGDPIVAVHSRLYLCRVAKQLIKWDDISCNSKLFDIILMNLNEIAILISRLDTTYVMRTIQTQHVDLGLYLESISSALQSIINLISSRNDLYTAQNGDHICYEAQLKFEQLYKCFIASLDNQNCSTISRDIIIHSITRALPPDIIANHAEEILNIIIKTYELNNKSRYASLDGKILSSTIYISIESFAHSLNASDKFESDSSAELKEFIFQSIKSILNDLSDHAESGRAPDDTLSANYLRCIKSWYSYADHYVNYENVDSFLGDFLVKAKKERRYVNIYPTLVDLVKIPVSSRKEIDEFRILFGTKSFSQLFELLHKDDIKLEASKWVLETIRSNLKLNQNSQRDLTSNKIADKITINFILKLFASINDSLSLLAADDDLEHLSQLVIYFLEMIVIQDYKEYLDFLSRCRSLVGNLNLVLEYLANIVLKLAVKFREHERKRNMRLDYLNGCLAFTFITAPAINNLTVRLNLYIEGSHLSLAHMSLSLADYYLKQSLMNVNEQLSSLEHRNGNAVQDTSTTNDIFYGNDRKAQVTVNKQLLKQMETLLDLFLKYEDHIDLKHKFELTSIIKKSFYHHSNLIECVKCLNVLDDNPNYNDDQQP